jgi:proline racemase
LRPHRGAVHADAASPAGQFAGRSFTAIDAHTEGMPERVVTDGVGVIPGATMLERKERFEAEMDELRLLLMREPRGHGAMSGAILQPPTRPDADWGVVFIEVTGCLPMCGHGTMGIATVLVETGMVEVVEPETVVRLETPAGLVDARVAVEGGRARAVTLRNVPAFLHAADVALEVDGLGAVTADLAFGGNFFAIVDAASLGLAVDAAAAPRLLDAGLRIMDAVDAAAWPVHPEDPRIAGCRHVIFTAPGTGGADARNATAIHPGYLDRSPCGTGTCARMAQLHARGLLAVGAPFVNVSPIGSRFTGRIVGETTVGGRPAVVPEITGRAWITGRGEYLLDPDDPYPAGFEL